MIRARRLNLGDKVKVILPASSLVAGHRMRRSYRRGRELLQTRFDLDESVYVNSDHLGFSAPDNARVGEIDAAIHNPETKALIAGRGGFGCLRLINHLDYEALGNLRPAIVGFSDLTILQLAAYQRIGLVSFSGPMLVNLTPKSLATLLPLLTESVAGRDLIRSDSKDSVEVLRDGTAEGVLVGGNLFSLVQLIGTGFMPRLAQAILFIEDEHETVNRIDSYLHHLKLTGMLYDVAGVVIGRLGWRTERGFALRRNLNSLFHKRLEGLFRSDTPVIFGVRYGHCDDSITIPIGARARLDTTAKSLTLIEEVTDE